MRRTRTWSSMSCGFLLLCCLGLGLGELGPVRQARALFDGEREFSVQEQRALAAGKLVVRRQTRQRGEAHFIGGLSWQVVEAEVPRVWAVLSDVTSYSRFLPAVAEAKRVARLPHSERIFIRHQYSFIDASYCVLVTPDPKRGSIHFQLDHSQPAAIAEAFGDLRVTSLGPGRSVISFAIMVDVGDGLIAGLLRSQVHEWMLRVPEQLEHHIKKQLRLEKAALKRREKLQRPGRF